MKRIFISVFLILLIGSSAGAANQVDIRFGGMGVMDDTLRAGVPATLDIYLENDFILSGMGLGFQVWSPDGATWTWNGGNAHGASGYVSSGYGRMGDGSVFDMTGLLVTEQNVDESGRDTLMCGGVALMQGLPIGPLEHMYSYHFIPDRGANEVATLCFDSCFVPPTDPFVFVDLFGIIYPTTLWPAGGLCYPVAGCRCDCPAWDPGLPTSMTVDHCETGSVTLSATDTEDNQIIFALRSLNGGAGTAEVIDNGDGTCLVKYTPVPSDVGQSISIDIDVWDPFMGEGNCPYYTLAVNVVNTPPEISCGLGFPDIISTGRILEKTITATDPDTCHALVFSMASGPGSIDPLTGEFTWQTTVLDVGIHEICVVVSDGIVTEQCCFLVEVFGYDPFQIAIEKVHDVLQGHYVDVNVCLNRFTDIMAGFDFLIGYDASALAFTEAQIGDYLMECGWEYFTYRYSWNGNCGNACPTGLVRLIGLAETNNGPYHPDWECLQDAYPTEGCHDCKNTIAALTFFVSNDRTLECMYLPIRFYWVDCNDNSLSSASGDSLYVSDHVYEFEGTDITDPMTILPGYNGIPDDPCMEGDKVYPIRLVDFCNGGIDVVCADSIDKRGDINLNGIPYEISDAVMFGNYFISGLPALAPGHWEGSIAASDINADGIPLSVADLVYLVRVIIGDAQPYPKPVPNTPVTISCQDGLVRYDSPVDIGAALLIFRVEGEIGIPQLGSGAVGMDMKYAQNGDQLRLLVFNIGSEVIPAGENALVTIPGQVRLTEAEFATYDGFGINVLVRDLPGQFNISNYPNPFNPSTTICLNLPAAAEWSVRIYNVAGQLITNYSGYAEAGVHNIVWSGTDRAGNRVASGIYFYKATAGQSSATRKMILTK
jgi:hypothetical protein